MAGLCRDLDGMPLAIELAAARVRVMSPEEIRDSLSERLHVLTPATATPLTGTGRCAPASSGPTSCAPFSEQKFWARSSVFSGGYELAAAAAVCAAEDLPAGEILDLVGGLVDQSIVLAEDDGTGHTRYRMLTDIRQFGLERAEKDGELRGMQERHATWCAELVSRFERRGLRAAPTGLASAASPGRRQPAGRPRATSRGHPRVPRPAWSWRGSSTCTGPPADSSTRPAIWLELALATGAGTPEERALAHGRGRPLCGPPARPGSGQGLVEEGTEVATGVGDTGRWVCCWFRPPCSRSGTAPPAAAADQADSAVPLLRAASNLPGELMALFVAGVCHAFRRQRCGGGRPAPTSASPGRTRSASAT